MIEFKRYIKLNKLDGDYLYIKDDSIITIGEYRGRELVGSQISCVNGHIDYVEEEPRFILELINRQYHLQDVYEWQKQQEKKQ